jgi:PDZ domain
MRGVGSIALQVRSWTPRGMAFAVRLMRKKTVFLGAVLALVASPAIGKQPGKILTPSGLPDMHFVSSTSSDVSSKLANKCMDGGLNIVTTTPTEVVCQVKMDDVSSVLTQALMGNSYSTSPEQFIKFNLLQSGSDVRVQGSGWVELQMALGQTRRQPTTSDEVHNSLMAFMEGAGATYYPGTIFPNSSYLGIIGVKYKPLQYRNKQIAGAVVGDVYTGSAADKAGIKPGDVLVALNGFPLKSARFLPLFLSVFKAGKTFKLTALRSAEEVTFNVTSEQRPPISEDEKQQPTLLQQLRPISSH